MLPMRREKKSPTPSPTRARGTLPPGKNGAGPRGVTKGPQPRPPPPPIGLTHSKTLTVEPGLTVPQVSPAFADFRNMPPVFATAYLVGFVEATCIEALKPYLTDGRMTVGTH